MINQLAVNGCSYMNYYARGKGHNDLARLLDIANVVDLSSPGSCNDRIIRTTYRHACSTSEATLYILGMTFLNRTELPILKNLNKDGDGHWISFQNFAFADEWCWPWTNQDTETFIDLHLKSQFSNMFDRAEDLMYKLAGLVSLLHSKGHRILIFQQAENRYQEFLSQLKLFHDPVFVNNFDWKAIPWQLNCGASPVHEDALNPQIPMDMYHVQSGQHQWLNNFLVNYIHTHNIL